MSRLVFVALTAISLVSTACDTKSQTFEYTTHSATAPISEVIIDLDSGSVDVVAGHDAAGGNVTQAKATAHAKWYGEPANVEFIEEGTVLRIVSTCGRHDTCGVDLEVEIPAGAVLTVDGDHTDVAIEGVKGKTTVETATGDLSLTKVGGRLDLSTREGTITGRDLTASWTEAQTFEGAIDLALTGPIATLMADTVIGDIRLTVPRVAYVVEAKTGDGTLDVIVEQASATRRFIHAIATERGDIWIGPPS